MDVAVDKTSGLTVLPDKENSSQCSGKNWKTTKEGIVFEKGRCQLDKKAKLFAVIFGFALAGCLIGALYFAGVFNEAPEFADALEGEADLVTDDGGKEIYGMKVDFDKKIIQLSFLKEMHDGTKRGRRDVNSVENHGPQIKKIVVQDFGNKKKYLLIPGKNGTTKCLKTTLTGEMLPKDLLKHARNEKIPDDVKQRVMQRLRFGDDSEADVLVPDGNETQTMIYKGIGFNMSLHAMSKRNIALEDLNAIKCFDYKEQTNKIEDAFYLSNQSKMLLDNINEDQAVQVQEFIRHLNATNATTAHLGRMRRSIMDKFTRWSHGNWCGAYTGGFENHCKHARGVCKAPYDKVSEACKNCNPAIDGIDEHCMEHDRCLLEYGPGPSGCLPQGNRCSCDYKLVLGAIQSGISCLHKGESECAKASATIGALFTTMLSCWYPSEVCFPGVKVQCGCSACSCPSVKVIKTCVPFKFCVPFGSGKVAW